MVVKIAAICAVIGCGLIGSPAVVPQAGQGQSSFWPR